MSQIFVAGGPLTIVTAAFGLMLVLSALVYAVRPERRFVPLQLSLGVLTLASGGLGLAQGMVKSLMATPVDDATLRWLWLVGLGESLNNVTLALGLILVAALSASVGTLRLALRPTGVA
jgi:hypothetical protein